MSEVLTKQKKSTIDLNITNKSLLSFITCGSVDDGKSSLIGRLLWETGTITKNEKERLKIDSERFGTQGENLDFALLLDGLSAEREQGITIDVAYRFFESQKRKFIVIDAPGHEQYTANMVTGSTHANAAVLLVDASKGLLTQTKRHLSIAQLVGIEHIILAVNKMDLVSYEHGVFDRIVAHFKSLISKDAFDSLTTIPLSAIKGDNISNHSSNTPWYKGKSLVSALEAIEPNILRTDETFVFPVQWVNRPNSEFRGFSGTIASGSVHVGDKVSVLPRGEKATIKQIVSFDNPSLQSAGKEQAVTLVLDKEIDISRGDLVCKKNPSISSNAQFQVRLIWNSQKPLIPGRQYILQLATQKTYCTISKIKYGIDINTQEKRPNQSVAANDIVVCEILLTKKIPCASYKNIKTLGGFILIDRVSLETAAFGFIDFALRRDNHIFKHDFSIKNNLRAGQKNQKSTIIWLTGLSGAGKSTIADLVDKALFSRGNHSFVLDGDNVRQGLNKDLGFKAADRAENIRRIAEVSRLMASSGLIVIVSFISPFNAEREMAKRIIGKDFIEVFIDTPLEAAEKRDVKGLYKKARSGEIKNFTGISSPYEAPREPNLHIKTQSTTASEAAQMIIDKLLQEEIIK